MPELSSSEAAMEAGVIDRAPVAGVGGFDEPLENRQRRAVLELQKGVAWPTIAYGAACILGFAGISGLALTGTIPLWLGCYFNWLIMMRTFAPLHEAVHGNMSGDVRSMKPVNAVLGTLLGAMVLLEFRTLRNAHLRHHRHANDAADDPDFWMAGNSAPRALLRCFAVIPIYTRWLYMQIRSQANGPGEALASIASHASVYGGAALAITFGPSFEVLMLWLLPAFVMSSLSAFTHWTLHTPHDSTQTFHNAKIVRGKGWRGYLISHYYNYQHYHLIHHLYPRIPFYRHRAAFDLLQPLLARKKAKIVDY